MLDDTPYLATDPNHAFSVDDLTAWEKKNGRVPRGAFVALRTDMYKDWDSNPERFQAQSVSGLGVRDDQVSLRAARRDRDRPRGDGHTDTTDKMDLGDLHALSSTAN